MVTGACGKTFGFIGRGGGGGSFYENIVVGAAARDLFLVT